MWTAIITSKLGSSHAVFIHLFKDLTPSNTSYQNISVLWSDAFIKKKCSYEDIKQHSNLFNFFIFLFVFFSSSSFSISFVFFSILFFLLAIAQLCVQGLEESFIQVAFIFFFKVLNSNAYVYSQQFRNTHTNNNNCSFHPHLHYLKELVRKECTFCTTMIVISSL